MHAFPARGKLRLGHAQRHPVRRATSWATLYNTTLGSKGVRRNLRPSNVCSTLCGVRFTRSPRVKPRHGTPYPFICVQPRVHCGAMSALWPRAMRMRAQHYAGSHDSSGGVSKRLARVRRHCPTWHLRVVSWATGGCAAGRHNRCQKSSRRRTRTCRRCTGPQGSPRLQ